MANEKFKVKFGLAVGDTVATIDGTTGNIVTSGDIQVNGGNILGPGGASDLIIENASTIQMKNDFTLFSTDAGVTKAYFNNLGGKFTFNGDDTTNPGINLYSNGTIGSLGNATIGGDVDVKGGDITNSTGALQITTASNGAITLAPNGTGNVVLTLANGGNLTNTRNYVNGIIRQTAAAAAGDVYGFGNVTYGTTTPYRGISLDNYLTATTTTGKRTGIVMRNYGLPPRNTILGEVARGTNPSTPLTVLSGVSLMEITGGGYYGGNTTTPGFLTFTSTGSSISGTTLTIGTVTAGTVAVGQVLAGGATAAGTIITGNISGSGSGSTWTVNISQTVGSSAINGGGDGWTSSTSNGRSGTISLYTAENWSSTNAGTGFTVATTPIGPYAGTIQTVLDVNSNTASIISDSQTFRTKPVAAGGTNKLMLQLTEATTTLTTDNFNVNSQANGTQLLSLNSLSGDVGLNIIQARATGSFDTALTNFSTFRWNGTQYTPTQINDVIGEFKFNGNANTGASPGVPSGPGANITANATENWTSTANGTRFNFQAVKTGTLNSYSVIQGTPDLITLSATTIDLNTFDGTTGITGNNITYNRVYGQWQYDATITPAAANTGYAIPFQGVNAAIDYANIATASNTSQIKPNALGMYKLQFSAQVQNSDNGQDHQITFWWRKNGVDITNSAGYFTVPKAGVANGSLIVGWDNMVEVTTITDYFELIYAVNNTAVTLPYIAASAPRPGAAAVFLTLVPVGA